LFFSEITFAKDAAFSNINLAPCQVRISTPQPPTYLPPHRDHTLAIGLTLAAIAGGQQVYAKFMRATAASASAAAAPVASVAKDVDGSEGDSVGAATDEDTEKAEDAEGAEGTRSAAPRVFSTEMDEKAISLGQRGYSKSSIKKNFSEWDMVWMSLAALAAYVTGKGGDKQTSVVATEARQDEATEKQQDSPENADA